MPEPDERPTFRFSDLNLLGKAVFLTGAVVRTTATLVDRAVEQAAAVYVDAEDAFRRELDGSFEDAKILEERYGDRSQDDDRDGA
ncbi:MAG: hypothetical protein GVY18_17640 [Bacteroidetes bacterium]|jgi:hypothetical protein|nr:hypothetical protein [Bacteroidota bacterium]